MRYQHVGRPIVGRWLMGSAVSLVLAGSFVALGPASAEAQQTGTWINLTGSGTFGYPTGLVVDKSGDIFVANENGTIEKGVRTSSTTFSWSSILPPPSSGGLGGIAVDSSGDLFVVEPATVSGSGSLSSTAVSTVEEGGLSQKAVS